MLLLNPHRFTYTPPPTLALDTVTGATFAASTRRLRGAFSGALQRWRRSSDNAETDVYGDTGASYAITTSSTVSAGGTLGTWLGSSDGYMVKAYDQISTRDVVQATAANQPKVASAGVVQAPTGTGTQYAKSANVLGLTGSFTVEANLSGLTHDGFRGIAGEWGSSGNFGWALLLDGSGIMAFWWTVDGTTYSSVTSSAAIATTERVRCKVTDTSGTLAVRFQKYVTGAWTDISNHTGLTGPVYAVTSGGVEYMVAGNGALTNPIKGAVSELVIWNRVLSDSEVIT